MTTAEVILVVLVGAASYGLGYNIYAMIRARLLGEFHVEVGGQVINRFPSRKVVSILGYLLRYPKRHTREQLMRLFWNDKQQGAARNNLRVSLSLIRKIVEPPGVPAGSVLQSERFWVRINPDMVETDVAEFEEACRRAAQCNDPVKRGQIYEQACALYTGDLLPDMEDDWVIAEREHLRQLYENALSSVHSIGGGLQSDTQAKIAEGLGAIVGIYSDLSDPRLRSWARAAAASQQGVLLSADVHRAFLFFNSLERGLKALDALQAQLKMCCFAVDIGEIHSSSLYGKNTLLKTIDLMLQAATPQQILCTERVAVLMAPGRTARRCRLLQLGCFRLHPHERSETLYQLDFTGCARYFPPLKVPPALHSALIDAPSPFVGREAELEQLQHWLHEGAKRLVTIVGAPGVGKSRLALECARRLEKPFGEARWWIYLSPDSSISETLARRMGWEWRDEATFVNALRSALGDLPALIVVDGLDDWGAASKEELCQLLHMIPNLRWLTTSYAPLNLLEEQVLFLKPLPVPPNSTNTRTELAHYESVQLFVKRVQQLVPQFQLSEHNAKEVAQLCRYLEGLPLAIELAAAHSGGRDLTLLLRQFQRSSRWLQERPPGALSRSLHASLATVYHALASETRQFWAKLSLFRGSFTIDAAQAVASPPDASSALAELKRLSLVQMQGDRYRLLEPVRLFAEARLKEGQLREQTASAFFHYYLGLATSLGSVPTRWRELEPERDNLRTALEWSYSHAPEIALLLAEALSMFWERNGCEQPIYQILLHLPERLQSRDACVRAVQIALNLAVRRGDMDSARSLRERFLPLAETLPETSVAAVRLWTTVGFYAWMEGEYDTSVAILQRAIQRARALNLSLEEANALVNLGVAQWTRNALSDAAESLERALLLIHADDAPILHMKATSNLANVLYQLGQRDAAEQRLIETLQMAQRLGDRRTVATLLNNWAVWLRERGEYERARALCLQASAIWQELHEAIGETASIFNLADIAFHEGDYETASLLFHRSIESILHYRLFWYLPHALENLAELARKRGDLKQAHHWHSLWLYACLRYSGEEQTARALRACAELERDLSNPREAARWSLLIEPISRQKPPSSLVRSLRQQISSAEWDRLRNNVRATTREHLIAQLQPMFEAFLQNLTY